MRERTNYGYIIFIVFVVLLFSIGFCRTVYGQEYITIKELEEYSHMERMIKEWEEYSKECYADSTLERIHEPPVAFKRGNLIYYEPCIIDWECLSESHYKNIWTHQKPIFEGFIKWLKEHYSYSLQQ